MKKSVIIIAGPTAVGKTPLAIAVAQHFHTEIISADSRQCYRELNIGVARPSATELATVPHHFIASHSIHDAITAAWYENYALDLVQQLFQQHDTVVMTGGTGLYIKAFCEGLDEIPPVPPAVRSALQLAYEEKGISWLQKELLVKDPRFAAEGEMQNPQRMLRALEVVTATGQSIFHFRSGQPVQRPFEIIRIGLDLPREALYNRINQRVDQMMKEGLLEEARSHFPLRHLNALQTVGYKELFDYFSGTYALDKAVSQIKQHTRHYAKRQLTWFRKQDGYNWFRPEKKEEILQLIDEKTTTPE